MKINSDKMKIDAREILDEVRRAANKTNVTYRIDKGTASTFKVVCKNHKVSQGVVLEKLMQLFLEQIRT